MNYYAEYSDIEHNCTSLKRNRIGLLGGTFNPVHNGHIAMAKIALYEFLLGEVIFLPLGTPPHKKEEYIAPPDCRLDMINLAIENEKRFSVSTIELYRQGYTYTIDTLKLLLNNNKNNEYYYIIGADTLFEIEHWKEYEKVIGLVSFICIPRPGLETSYRNIYAEELNNKYGYKFFVSNEKGPDISSSLIRELAAHSDLYSGLMPGSVADYIRRNRIYCKED